MPVPESILATGTGTAFIVMGKKFQAESQVNHSETLMGSEGQHNRNAESFSARQDRAEKGRWNPSCATRPSRTAILNRLMADPSLYVRKSVTNHLNDISKDQPG